MSTENPTDCNKKILIFRDFLFETFIIMSAYHTVSLNILFSNKRRKFSLRRMRNCRLYIQRVSPGALDDALKVVDESGLPLCAIAHPTTDIAWFMTCVAARLFRSR